MKSQPLAPALSWCQGRAAITLDGKVRARSCCCIILALCHVITVSSRRFVAPVLHRDVLFCRLLPTLRLPLVLPHRVPEQGGVPRAVRGLLRDGSVANSLVGSFRRFHWSRLVVSIDTPADVPPTRQPSAKPSRKPSAKPSRKPSAKPSRDPSSKPSNKPSNHPSAKPSRKPSSKPSDKPSNKPSSSPSNQPSDKPSSAPSNKPSSKPSAKPSRKPSSKPSKKPSATPSENPSRKPTKPPTKPPTFKPTGLCTDTAWAVWNVATPKQNCLNTLPGLTSNKWGWFLGPITSGYSVTHKIYAGAGQCDLTKGTCTGKLTVEYYGNKILITVLAPKTGYYSVAHYWVGTTQLPKKNGAFTDAPGSFNKTKYPSSPTFGTYTTPPVSGPMYVAVHLEWSRAC